MSDGDLFSSSSGPDVERSVRLGAAVWIFAIQFFIAQLVVQSAWTTPFSLMKNYISRSWHVGKNLQDHPAGKLLGRCPKPSTLFSAESFGNLLRYFFFHRGMLSSNGAEALAFIRTQLDLDAPDVEIMLSPIPADLGQGLLASR